MCKPLVLFTPVFEGDLQVRRWLGKDGVIHDCNTFFYPFSNLHVVLVWTWQMLQGLMPTKAEDLNHLCLKRLMSRKEHLLSMSRVALSRESVE